MVDVSQQALPTTSWTPHNLHVMARSRLKSCDPQDCQHKGPLGCVLEYIVTNGGHCVSYRKRLTQHN